MATKRQRSTSSSPKLFHLDNIELLQPNLNVQYAHGIKLISRGNHELLSSIDIKTNSSSPTPKNTSSFKFTFINLPKENMTTKDWEKYIIKNKILTNTRNADEVKAV
ncbi:hypothetical protein EBV26_16850, partial [bacterium]|nr:hypothetical protein [bacterium]